VVAALASGPAEGLEQLGIGQSGEEIPDGSQRGAIFERLPIEQRLGGMKDHHGRGDPGWNEAIQGRYGQLRNESPRRWPRGRKIVSAGALRGKAPKKSMVSGGTFAGSPRRVLIL